MYHSWPDIYLTYVKSQAEWRHNSNEHHYRYKISQKTCITRYTCDLYFFSDFLWPVWLPCMPGPYNSSVFRFNYIGWLFYRCVLQYVSILPLLMIACKAWDRWRRGYNIGICIGTYLCLSSVTIINIESFELSSSADWVDAYVFAKTIELIQILKLTDSLWVNRYIFTFSCDWMDWFGMSRIQICVAT